MGTRLVRVISLDRYRSAWASAVCSWPALSGNRCYSILCICSWTTNASSRLLADQSWLGEYCSQMFHLILVWCCLYLLIERNIFSFLDFWVLNQQLSHCHIYQYNKDIAVFILSIWTDGPETVWTQIRRRRTRRLIWVYTVASHQRINRRSIELIQNLE